MNKSIRHEKEEFNMLALQWNIDDAKTAWQQEAREEGRLEGTFSTEIRNLKRLMEKMHMTIDEAMDFSDIPKEDRAKYSVALTNNIGSN